MEDTVDLYREAVDVARAELLDVLTRMGTTPQRAQHLVDALEGAVRDMAVAEAGDAAQADLEALTPRLGVDADALVWLADHARWTGSDRYYNDTAPTVARN